MDKVPENHTMEIILRESYLTSMLYVSKGDLSSGIYILKLSVVDPGILEPGNSQRSKILVVW